MKYKKIKKRIGLVLAVLIGTTAIIPITPVYAAINESLVLGGGGASYTGGEEGYIWSGNRQFVRISLIFIRWSR